MRRSRVCAGFGRLASAAAAPARRLVASGAIRPADRVRIAAAGPPGLAAARGAAVCARAVALGHRRRSATARRSGRDRAVVTVGRYAVTLPPCPNWSQPRANDFTNAPPSNFGCATAVNLGLMVASPADLVGGRQLAPADGKPAAAAVNRYLER